MNRIFYWGLFSPLKNYIAIIVVCDSTKMICQLIDKLSIGSRIDQIWSNVNMSANEFKFKSVKSHERCGELAECCGNLVISLLRIYLAFFIYFYLFFFLKNIKWLTEKKNTLLLKFHGKNSGFRFREASKPERSGGTY